MKPMKIGIFGGTFNPIHYAHLRIAEEIREAFSLTQVVFVPASSPPHKPLADDLAFADRLRMVSLAVADNPFFVVSDLESRREGKSYSIDTINTFRELHPGAELFFIMGSDSFAELSSWRRYTEIFASCNIVTITRPGTAIRLLEEIPAALAHEFCYDEAQQRLAHCSGHSVYSIEGTQLDISSTAIRSRIKQGKSITYLLPATVEHYITQQRLYARTDEN
jgi:nicotinate-nucleotide adenylyltransferase